MPSNIGEKKKQNRISEMRKDTVYVNSYTLFIYTFQFICFEIFKTSFKQQLLIVQSDKNDYFDQILVIL